jgi:internalin A
MRMLVSVLMVLAMVGVGQADDKDIIEGLRKAGATVYYAGEQVCVILDGHSANTCLPELCELHNLFALNLIRSGMTEAQMQTVCALNGLRQLDLDSCPVTDAHLKQVVRLRELQSLSLVDTRVTDAGIEQLIGLGDLVHLWLESTAVTDAGLRHIERLKRLKMLDLRNCPNITDAGIARLQKALPKCKILR